jgi:hypothetical protein
VNPNSKGAVLLIVSRCSSFMLTINNINHNLQPPQWLRKRSIDPGDTARFTTSAGPSLPSTASPAASLTMPLTLALTTTYQCSELSTKAFQHTCAASPNLPGSN